MSGAGPAAAGAVAQVFVADLEAPVLSDDDAHHLARVLRVRPGEPVVAADGYGGWRLCRYRPQSPSSAGSRGAPAELEVDGPRRVQPESTDKVTVGFVPVKGERPEWVVQKLTELGVDCIAVLHSERSVVRWEGERAAHALDRLRRVSREAAAQSRRARLPAVEGIWTLAELSAAVAPQPLAVADRVGSAPDSGLRCLAVGPEGGWEPAEPGVFRQVSLGPGVLRAETAAVAAATVLCALRDGRLWAPTGAQ